jgi:outer membrane protein TolC
VYSDPEEDLGFVRTDSLSDKTYELLELQKSINGESLAQQASASYPTLDLFAAAQWLQQEGYGDLFSSDGTWFNRHVIGLKLNVPILNPESRKTKSQEIRINQDIISMQQELLLERTRMEREKALNDLELAREELQLADEKQQLFSKQFDQAQVRYEQQYSSLQELLNAEEKFRSARISFQQQKIAYFLAILEVYESFDQLDEFND